jgi:hypothetical protein
VRTWAAIWTPIPHVSATRLKPTNASHSSAASRQTGRRFPPPAISPPELHSNSLTLNISLSPRPHHHNLEMGNLCGKESKSDNNFQGPGRTLGAAPPPQPSKASVPARIANTNSNSNTEASKPKPTPTVGGPGRTVGSASAGGSEQGGDPRSAAAAAAEVRSLRLKLGMAEVEVEKGQVQGERWPKKPMMTSVWM